MGRWRMPRGVAGEESSGPEEERYPGPKEERCPGPARLTGQDTGLAGEREDPAQPG
jgi:hypothetical protein